MLSVAKLSISAVVFAVGVLFSKRHFNGPMCTSPARLDGKVVLVTGANTGIGKETALDLVQRGGTVYLACRSMLRGQAAADDIRNATGVGEDRVKVMNLDLTSLASVRQFAKEFKSKEEKLDILVNNAGIMLVPYEQTTDGFELNIGVNHLGHFLLTNLLLELLVKSAPSRIINVSSRAHQRAGPMDFDSFVYREDTEAKYSTLGSYSQSKLANILFTNELERRLTDLGVHSYSLHPGVVQTELPRQVRIFTIPVVKDIVNALFWPFWKDPKHGAQTSICCAVEPNLTPGKYYSDCAETAAYYGMLEDVDGTAKKLWQVSQNLVQLTPEETHPAVAQR